MTAHAAPRQIRQHGPRRLWDEVEAAFHSWAATGKPPLHLHRSQITSTPDSQTVAAPVPQATLANHPSHLSGSHLPTSDTTR